MRGSFQPHASDDKVCFIYRLVFLHYLHSWSRTGPVRLSSRSDRRILKEQICRTLTQSNRDVKLFTASVSVVYLINN